MEFRRIRTREEIYEGIDLWNRLNPSLHIIPQLIEQNIVSPFPNIEVLAWGAFKNNQLIAFALTKYLTSPISDDEALNQGWISLLIIEKEKVDFGFEVEKLLKDIEEDLKSKGVERIYFGGDPQNFFPGLPDCLEDDYLLVLDSLGYKKKNVSYDLYSDISNFNVSSLAEPLMKKLDQNLSVRAVIKSEEKILLNFLRRNFSGRWYYEADNIRHIHGGIEDYWLLWYQDNPVGFVRANTSESAYMGTNVNWGSQWGERYCGLGPFGIADGFRGKGWGTYLAISVIQAFQKQGYSHMVIDWTTLVDYYVKFGFRPWIKYFMIYKKL